MQDHQQVERWTQGLRSTSEPSVTAITSLSRPDLPRPPRIITTGLTQHAQYLYHSSVQQPTVQEQPGSSGAGDMARARQSMSPAPAIVVIPPGGQEACAPAVQAPHQDLKEEELPTLAVSRPRRASAQRSISAPLTQMDDPEGTVDTWYPVSWQQSSHNYCKTGLHSIAVLGHNQTKNMVVLDSVSDQAPSLE